MESIFSQHFVALEIIAINDGSTDQSAEILTRYASRDSRLRVVHQKNQGPARTRNAALEMARGQYIWFVDSDDILVKDAISYVYDIAIREKLQMLLFNAQRFSDQETSIGKLVYTRLESTPVIPGEVWIQRACDAREFAHLTCLALIERDFLVQNKSAFYEDILHEDIPWTTINLLRAKRVSFSSRVLYRYRQNPGSITGSADDARILQRIESYFIIIRLLRKANTEIPMQPATLLCLRSECVAQAIQVDELLKQIKDVHLRNAVQGQLIKIGFWKSIWSDAVNIKRKRQLIAIMFKQRF